LEQRAFDSLAKPALLLDDDATAVIAGCQLDVATAFKSYVVFGRMINLADWQEMFEEDASTADQRAVEMIRASMDEHAEEAFTQHELPPKYLLELRSRFAQVVGEFEMRGLIERTTRRTDHVVKTMAVCHS
jgi:Origin recognition complex winged helix C-terminal